MIEGSFSMLEECELVIFGSFKGQPVASTFSKNVSLQELIGWNLGSHTFEISPEGRVFLFINGGIFCHD